MATATATKPANTCRLLIEIRGVSYVIRPVEATAFGAAGRAWRLRRAGEDGATITHHVADTLYGAECDCGDFTFRREGLDPAGCKHVRALRAAGLLDALRP